MRCIYPLEARLERLWEDWPQRRRRTASKRARSSSPHAHINAQARDARGRDAAGKRLAACRAAATFRQQVGNSPEQSRAHNPECSRGSERQLVAQEERRHAEVDGRRRHRRTERKRQEARQPRSSGPKRRAGGIFFPTPSSFFFLLLPPLPCIRLSCLGLGFRVYGLECRV